MLLYEEKINASRRKRTFTISEKFSCVVLPVIVIIIAAQELTGKDRSFE